MQAISITEKTVVYGSPMQTGRPSTRPRTPFGAKLHAAREAKGFTQSQVAGELGITQTAYALWERRPVALKPDQIEKVAKVLGVRGADLFSGTDKPRARGGSIGKLQRLLEAASSLPRNQQLKLIAVVEPFVEQHSNGS
jgi:transcriptional regulator with XRE-family HTH domain